MQADDLASAAVVNKIMITVYLTSTYLESVGSF